MKVSMQVALALMLLATLAIAQPLKLSLDSQVYLYQLDVDIHGAAAFDDQTGHLWLAASGYDSVLIAEIDPITGQMFRRLRSTVLPGGNGISAMAIHPVTGNLFLFKFAEIAGEVTQSGTTLNTFPSHYVTAAAFDEHGDLYVVSILPPFDAYSINRVNQATGELETSVPISGRYSVISSMDFDPAGGRLFLHETERTLLEVDLATGDVISVTNLKPFVGSALFYDFWAAFAFSETGERLFITTGWLVAASPPGGETLYVLDRNVPECFTVASFSDLGNGLPGAFGFTPTLSGLQPAGSCDVLLQFGSFVQASEMLVIGFSPISAPFKGGVLVPAPDVLLANVFDAAGALLFDVSPPLLGGMTVFMQVWVPDPAGPSGFAASNGLSMTVH